MESILTKKQKKSHTKIFRENGTTYKITVHYCFDDACGNGHNTFAITADIDRKAKNGRWVEYSGGCLHDEIRKHFPELAPFIKWHLVSTDGPMHYIANARYHAGFGKYSEKNIPYLQKTIVYGTLPIDREISLEQLDDERLVSWLTARLPDLLIVFKADMEKIGFTY